MHELAIAEALVSGVTDKLGAEPEIERVTRVIVEIGRLSGVVPDAVRFSFEVCAQGTPLENAALEIVEIEGMGRCRACGAEVAIGGPWAECGRCGDGRVEIVRGQELRIKGIEVI
jgi:hydrogenase nickel incorporation protein HypA/HybF